MKYYYEGSYRFYYFKSIIKTALIIQILISQRDGYITVSEMSLGKDLSCDEIQKIAMMKIASLESM